MTFKRSIMIMLFLIAGFLGGLCGSLTMRPVLAQGTSTTSVRVFIDGQEIVPKDGIINIDFFSGINSNLPELHANVWDGHVHIRLDPPYNSTAK